MLKYQAIMSASALLKQPEQASLGKNNLLSYFESIVCPAALVLSLWGVAFRFEGELPPPYLILSVMVFALTPMGH